MALTPEELQRRLNNVYGSTTSEESPTSGSWPPKRPHRGQGTPGQQLEQLLRERGILNNGEINPRRHIVNSR